MQRAMVMLSTYGSLRSRPYAAMAAPGMSAKLASASTGRRAAARRGEVEVEVREHELAEPLAGREAAEELDEGGGWLRGAVVGEVERAEGRRHAVLRERGDVGGAEVGAGHGEVVERGRVQQSDSGRETGRKVVEERV